VLAQGRSTVDALDSGYRLAFTIALASVLLGIVLGFFILKPTRTPAEQPDVVDESLAAAETMIAEVL
jgi:hypothetical protein